MAIHIQSLRDFTDKRAVEIPIEHDEEAAMLSQGVTWSHTLTKKQTIPAASEIS